MYTYHKLTTLFLFFILIIGCRSSQKTGKATKNGPNIVLLDKAEAEKKIVIDRTDGFFERITITDMSIQLKKGDVSEDRNEVLKEYKQLLKNDMSDFSESDVKFMDEVFTSAKAHLDKINPKLWRDNMEIYKTKTNHYGPSVYYTRENGIIIPEDVFSSTVEAQMPIMLHEIFHILSRYKDNFRDKMYALIGFKKHNYDIKIPDIIKNRVLTNPDGIRTDYAIYLEDSEGNVQPALPVLLATKGRYTSSVPSFFAYLQFDLYPIIKSTDGTMTLGIDEQGESTLSLEHNADFFKKIKDNTQYIIHPDEVLADNFMMAVIANERGDFEGFSPEGTALLKEVLAILKDFE